MKKILFTVSVKDCVVQTFRAGGKGGQHQNKTESGVRVIHPPSGAVGEGRETKSQLTNKRLAFSRMASTNEFKLWRCKEVSRLTGRHILGPAKQKSAGFGDRYLRTYDFGDRYVKDNETGHTRHDMEAVLNGDIDSFILARQAQSLSGGND